MRGGVGAGIRGGGLWGTGVRGLRTGEFEEGGRTSC